VSKVIQVLNSQCSFNNYNAAVWQEYSMWLCEELGMEKNSQELHVVTPLHLRKFEVLSRQERYHRGQCFLKFVMVEFTQFASEKTCLHCTLKQQRDNLFQS